MKAETVFEVFEALPIDEQKRFRVMLGRDSDKLASDNLVVSTLKALSIYDANNTCMSVEECAEFLRVHKNTVTNQIQRGSIKATLIGRVWRIPKLQFIESIIPDTQED